MAHSVLRGEELPADSVVRFVGVDCDSGTTGRVAFDLARFVQLIIARCWQRTSTLPPNRDPSDSATVPANTPGHVLPRAGHVMLEHQRQLANILHRPAPGLLVRPCSFRLVRGYCRVGPATSLRSTPGRNGASEAGGFPCNVRSLAHVKGDVMAEHPDVALVRRGYAAFSAGDMATLSELLAEDARQYQPGSGANKRRVQGT